MPMLIIIIGGGSLLLIVLGILHGYASAYNEEKPSFAASGTRLPKFRADDHNMQQLLQQRRRYRKQYGYAGVVSSRPIHERSFLNSSYSWLVKFHRRWIGQEYIFNTSTGESRWGDE